MNKKEFLRKSRIYFITDSRLTRKNIFEDVMAAVNGGVKIVQYREKNKSKEEMVKEAKRIQEICKEKNVIFLVNDFVDIAIEVNADGVHLGMDDLAYEKAREILGNEKIVGLTVHNMHEALDAQNKGADYLGISPVFDTETKKDAGKGMGLSKLKEIVAKINIPCFGIGGINQDNYKVVMNTGVDGICMISAIVCQKNIEETVKNFIKKIKN